MTTIEIKAKEKELIKEIDSDATLLDYALQYVKRKKRELKTLKCQFSPDELENELQQSEEDIEAGRVYSQDEMRKLHPEWK
ncbi:hypothetical protein [Dysgonomonas sp. 521]|uniref:hypothetical protein n=1 Tax=Dysgonomonas sp. 521 TaxID=2302932 RepID=UPI0013D1255C|nr:hypothetical protein [Dysgonomonas sp. 521]